MALFSTRRCESSSRNDQITGTIAVPHAHGSIEGLIGQIGDGSSPWIPESPAMMRFFGTFLDHMMRPDGRLDLALVEGEAVEQPAKLPP